jgi:uncharacterized protein YjbI with pentapeptide repeats
MKKITQEQLATILAEHKLFIDSGGEKGTGADLFGADLSGANLRKARLTDANLTDADLSETE